MKAAVEELYALLLRFFIRARDWYEGPLKHLVHSVTRPVELRYNDLLEQISCASGAIRDIARSGQLVETRTMHDKTKELHEKTTEMHGKIGVMHEEFGEMRGKLNHISTAMTC